MEPADEAGKKETVSAMNSVMTNLIPHQPLGAAETVKGRRAQRRDGLSRSGVTKDARGVVAPHGRPKGENEMSERAGMDGSVIPAPRGS